jgi:hypothetical protein
MTLEDPGRSQGREFAQIAVDLQLKDLPPERWGEFMRHRMAALALDLASDDERRRWAEALLQSYADALDDTDALVLEVRSAQAGRDGREKAPSAGAGVLGEWCRGGAT